MAQQLVIQDGVVVATHETYQDLTDKYPGCELVTWNGTPVPARGEDGLPLPDPRSS